jgi:hypothetical protein
MNTTEPVILRNEKAASRSLYGLPNNREYLMITQPKSPAADLERIR